MIILCGFLIGVVRGGRFFKMAWSWPWSTVPVGYATCAGPVGTIFNSSFETGDFTEWSGVGGAPSIVNAPVKSGVWAAKFDASGEYAKETGLAAGTLYCRVYFQRSGDGSWGMNNFITFQETGGWTKQCKADVVNDGGVFKFQLRYFDSVGAEQTVISAKVCAENVWYCVELYFKKNTVGGAVLYVDDVSVASAGAGTTQNQDTAEVDVGERDADDAKIHYVDCAVLSASYIGL